MKLIDLQAAKVKKVALMPGSESGLLTSKDSYTFAPGKDPYDIAQKLPYLKLQKQVGATRIYDVVYDSSLRTDASICAIPYGQ